MIKVPHPRKLLSDWVKLSDEILVLKYKKEREEKKCIKHDEHRDYSVPYVTLWKIMKTFLWTQDWYWAASLQKKVIFARG